MYWYMFSLLWYLRNSAAQKAQFPTSLGMFWRNFRVLSPTSALWWHIRRHFLKSWSITSHPWKAHLLLWRLCLVPAPRKWSDAVWRQTANAHRRTPTARVTLKRSGSRKAAKQARQQYSHWRISRRTWSKKNPLSTKTPLWRKAWRNQYNQKTDNKFA